MGRLAGAAGSGAGAAALVRIEPVHARPQLPVLVPQLPVRFGEPLEPFGQRAAPRTARPAATRTAAPVSSH